MSPAEGVGEGLPTCTWYVDVEGDDDVDSLEKRVCVLYASDDGAFERQINDVMTGNVRPEITLRGVPGKTPCELVVPLPEGAAARAVAVISGARTVELYAVRPLSYERAYLKTVRASVVVPSSETSHSGDNENARRRFECVAELGSVPCVALVLRLFCPSSGAAANGDATLDLRGVVVEVKEARGVRRPMRWASTPTTPNNASDFLATRANGGSASGSESAPAVPMGSPLRLDALEAAAREVAGLPPTPGIAMGMSSSSAAAMLTMLRTLTAGELNDAPKTSEASGPSKLTEENRREPDGNTAMDNAVDNVMGRTTGNHGDAFDFNALSRRVDRIETLLTRIERGMLVSFQRMENQLRRFEASGATRNDANG
jgi:hypothetical protein